MTNTYWSKAKWKIYWIFVILTWYGIIYQILNDVTTEFSFLVMIISLIPIIVAVSP